MRIILRWAKGLILVFNINLGSWDQIFYTFLGLTVLYPILLLYFFQQPEWQFNKIRRLIIPLPESSDKTAPFYCLTMPVFGWWNISRLAGCQFPAPEVAHSLTWLASECWDGWLGGRENWQSRGWSCRHWGEVNYRKLSKSSLQLRKTHQTSLI